DRQPAVLLAAARGRPALRPRAGRDRPARRRRRALGVRGRAVDAPDRRRGAGADERPAAPRRARGRRERRAAARRRRRARDARAPRRAARRGDARHGARPRDRRRAGAGPPRVLRPVGALSPGARRPRFGPRAVVPYDGRVPKTAGRPTLPADSVRPAPPRVRLRAPRLRGALSRSGTDAGGTTTGRIAMARPDKAAAVAEISEKFRDSNAAVLTEYRGLTVAQLKQLRRSLSGNATYAVVKNTLTAIAAKEAGVEGLDADLQGPSAIAFVTGDPVEAAKGLRDFAKANPALVIKGGVLDGRPLTA